MHNHKAKKSLGQNFLINTEIIDKIIKNCRLSMNDTVIEIGPGLGALTEKIIKITGKLNVIEYDKDVIPALVNKCSKLGELNIFNEDILKINLSKFFNNTNSKLKIIGNLPYNISSPLIFRLLEYSKYIEEMVFMLQKEVVARICALPGNKKYGRLSVMIQYFCTTDELFLVPPSSFSPPPKIDSQIIRLTPHRDIPYLAENYNLFSDIVRNAFTQRRKTIRNSLRNFMSEKDMINININPQLRAENISVEEFVRIANYINKKE